MSAQISMPRCGAGVSGRGLLLAARIALLAALHLPGLAAAAIPLTERNALIDLYNSTNGAGWTNNTNWNGAVGTECTWYGVFCGGGDTYVYQISLTANQLNGTLPASLNSLTELTDFYASDNQLSGSIPSLSGLTKLEAFAVGANQLTGPIPSLSSLTALQSFYVYDNQLTGPIPSLSGLTALELFDVSSNQLTGPIPSLSGLTALERFDVSSNQLTGPIPSLSGLTALQRFDVSSNQLSGPAPLVPNPNNLGAGDSALCPNYLSPSTGTPNDLAWDTAVGSSPWSATCTLSAGGAAEIPTLHEWALLLLSVLFGGLLWRTRRRFG
jgi:hypothetical protein